MLCLILSHACPQRELKAQEDAFEARRLRFEDAKSAEQRLLLEEEIAARTAARHKQQLDDVSDQFGKQAAQLRAELAAAHTELKELRAFKADALDQLRFAYPPLVRFVPASLSGVQGADG